MNAYEVVLRALRADLHALNVEWALVGGFAVSTLGSGRSTTDVDLVAAVVDDREAERMVFQMRQFGYRNETQLEQEATGRLSTVRFLSPHSPETRILVDCIFSTTGVETEIVAGASDKEVFRGLTMPVASPAHLIAMKVLSFADHRPNDLWDIATLLPICSDEDIADVRSMLRLIDERGYSRGRDLNARLEEAIRRASPENHT